jgi:hypothetical protein
MGFKAAPSGRELIEYIKLLFTMISKNKEVDVGMHSSTTFIT